MLIALWCAAQCLRPSLNLSLTAADFEPQREFAGSVARSEDARGVCYVVTGQKAAGKMVLTSRPFRLYPGAYSVKARYSSRLKNAPAVPGFSDSMGSLALSSARHGVFFSFNRLDLRDPLDGVCQSVQISSPTALDDMRLSVFYSKNNDGRLAVYGVTISEIVIYKYVLAVLLVAVFLLLDWLAVGFMSGRFGAAEGILCVICFVAVVPFMADYSFVGHDLNFHLNRIVCLADELRRGNFFPAVYSTALNGFGYANPLFYPHIFLYFPAVLYSCGFSLTAAYNIYIAVLSVATCLVMYCSAVRIFGKQQTALIVAALYTLSAVRLMNIFTRAAVGEFTAQTFLPLVVLGFYNIYSAESGEAISLKKYLPLVVGATGVLWSHVLSVHMCAQLAALFCLLAFRQTFERRRFAALCKAAALTVLASLYFLVPFIQSMFMDLRVKKTVNIVQSHGTYPLQLFNVVVDNFQRPSVPGTAAEEISLSFGFSLTLGMLLFAWCLANRKSDRREPRFVFSKICFALACVCLALTSIFVPYDALDFLPGAIYKALTVIQFPWRWLVFAALFGSYCTAYALSSAWELNSRAAPFALCAVAAALCLNMGQIYADQINTTGLPRFSNNSYSYNMSIGSGEYLLCGEPLVTPARDRANFNRAELIYDKKVLDVRGYRLGSPGASFFARNRSGDAAPALLPIICYDNYHAYDSKGGELRLTRGQYDRISVFIPPGFSDRVSVRYCVPRSWLAARAVSLVTLLFLAAWGARRRREGAPPAGRIH